MVARKQGSTKTGSDGRVFRSDEDKAALVDAWVKAGKPFLTPYCKALRDAGTVLHPNQLGLWAERAGHVVPKSRMSPTKPGAKPKDKNHARKQRRLQERHQLALSADGAAVIPKQAAPRAPVEGLEEIKLAPAFGDSGERKENAYAELLGHLQAIPAPRARLRVLALIEELSE